MTLEWSHILTTAAARPVFKHVLPYLEAFGSEWPSVESYNQVARSLVPDFKFTFTPQVKIKNQKFSGSLASYIEGITQRREIATRVRSLHDLFNALTYFLFPKTKAILMELHRSESLTLPVTTKKGGRGRTRKQDLLTLFDEGGAIRTGEKPSDIILFGHGVYEQFMVRPQPIRVFTWHVFDETIDSERLYARLDERMADALLGSEIFADSSQVKGELLEP